MSIRYIVVFLMFICSVWVVLSFSNSPLTNKEIIVATDICQKKGGEVVKNLNYSFDNLKIAYTIHCKVNGNFELLAGEE